MLDQPKISFDGSSARTPPGPNAPAMIQAEGLVKRYKQNIAVNHVDLTVRTGEIFGILGPNGAGKTTTLEMIEGLRVPDEGTIRVAGFDVKHQAEHVRQVIGVQLQTTALFDYLNVGEIVELFAALYGVDASPRRRDELLGMVGLTEKRSARVDQLSGGQQQRLSIALAFINDPQLVFLDEPTTGLDPVARRTLWDTIRSINARGTTVVLTTHYMEEAQVLCDRIAIMDRGRLIACDTPRALVASLQLDATITAVISAGILPLDAVERLPGVQSVLGDGQHQPLQIQTADVQGTLVGLLELAQQYGATLAQLGSQQANLEDVFVTLTGRTYEQGDSAAGEPTDEPKRRRRRR